VARGEVIYRGADLERITTGVWDCHDVLPAEYCDLLTLAVGSTYATAARMLRAPKRATYGRVAQVLRERGNLGEGQR
jgi:hypothetical protein